MTDIRPTTAARTKRADRRRTPRRPATHAEGITWAERIDAIRTLAASGKHAAAIEAATTALQAGSATVGAKMEVLDLRAESYIALGNVATAAEDASAMVD